MNSEDFKTKLKNERYLINMELKKIGSELASLRKDSKKLIQGIDFFAGGDNIDNLKARSKASDISAKIGNLLPRQKDLRVKKKELTDLIKREIEIEKLNSTHKTIIVEKERGK